MFSCTERDRLWRDYQPLVFNLMRRWRRVGEAQGDFVGDLYVRFAELLDRYDPERGIALCAYLSISLKGFCYSRWRAAHRQEGREVAWSEDLPRFTAGCVDPTREWDADLFKQDAARWLSGVLPDLPPKKRRALVLRYLKQMEYDAVGAEMGVKPTTARSLVRHALSELRQRYEAYLGPSGLTPSRLPAQTPAQPR
jgi:RNA polymerase sigma factor (sigma-70 family)